MLIVKKYGGSSVGSPEKILSLAKKLKTLADEGTKLIVIVSAMGDTTDELVHLSRQITLTPVQREMDMLLSSGERISMALMAMALHSVGCEAISFTGSQSGVFTDGSHNNARIKSIKAFRVMEELEKQRVVIIAGFQGVYPETKEITTLGRGGSDTTAVAMAAQFKADRCDILTDVRGLYTVDPRIPNVTPLPIKRLDYEAALEMTYWGARVLHYRSVELAMRAGVPLLVHLSSEEGSGTLIDSMENAEFLAVNYSAHVAQIHFGKDFDLTTCLEFFDDVSQKEGIPHPQIISEQKNGEARDFFVTAPIETFENLEKSLKEGARRKGLSEPQFVGHWATVTLTGRGFVGSNVSSQLAQALKKVDIHPEAMILTPLSVSFVVPETRVQQAAQLVHKEFVEKSSS